MEACGAFDATSQSKDLKTGSISNKANERTFCKVPIRVKVDGESGWIGNEYG